MNLSIFLPRAALEGTTVPVVYWLSGLTCTEDNFIQKAGAQRVAAELGLALVCPDTSPRGAGVEEEEESWDFGTGAGFYVDATTPAYKTNYNMYRYVVEELPLLVTEALPLSKDRKSIFGHSMGGHGALICFLKNNGYSSVSAFAPICHPSACPWGVKAFTGYLGPEATTWAAYDATALVQSPQAKWKVETKILVDQGLDDGFYKQKQLLPEDFLEAAGKAGVPVEYRERTGYDHSYFYISTFIEEHLRFHARHLQ